MISIQFKTQNKKDHFNFLFFQKLPNFNFLNENHRNTFLNRAHSFSKFHSTKICFRKKNLAEMFGAKNRDGLSPKPRPKLVRILRSANHLRNRAARIPSGLVR